MKHEFNGKTYNIPDREIEALMKLGITKEEAVTTWLDDEGITVNAEQEQSVADSKKLGRHYEQSGKARKKTTKERKVDETKGWLLGCTKTLIEGMGATNITIKTETELNFDYEGENYTFKLTKHRKKG